MEPAVATIQRLACGSRGGRRRREADLGEEAVLLAGVARPARRHHVVPGVRAATGAGHHVVDVLGRPVAVLAAVPVAGEHGPARQRHPVAVRHPDEVVQADHRRHGQPARSEWSSAPLRATISAFSFSTSTTARRIGTTHSGSKLALSSRALPKRRHLHGSSEHQAPVRASYRDASARSGAGFRARPGTTRGRSTRSRGIGACPARCRTGSRSRNAQVLAVGQRQERRAAPPPRAGQAAAPGAAPSATATGGRARARTARTRTPVPGNVGGARSSCGAHGTRTRATPARSAAGPSGTVGAPALEVFVVQPATAPSRDSSFGRLFSALLDNVEHVIQGKREQVHLALVCLLAEGHLLIEDVPGVGKTSLAKAIARSIGGTCHRIQFTPDLLPVRRHRRVGVEPRRRRVRVPPRRGLRQRRARRRDQPRVAQDPVGAARGDGGAPGHRRRAHLPAAAAVHGDRHAEPDRARGHLSAARGAARPLPHAHPDGLPRPRRRARDPRGAGPARRRTVDALDAGGERGRRRRRRRRWSVACTSPPRSATTSLDLVAASRRHPDLVLGASPRGSLVVAARRPGAGRQLRPRRT